MATLRQKLAVKLMTPCKLQGPVSASAAHVSPSAASFCGFARER